MKKKKVAKRIALVITAVAVAVGGVNVGTTTANAASKGTGFINQKTTSVNPTVKVKRVGDDKVKVTVSVPKSKLKKIKGRKVTVAYGSAKGAKFENVRKKATAVKSGNKYTFNIKADDLRTNRNTYVTVKLNGSNWSKLAKVSNKGFTYKKRTRVEKKVGQCRWCSCGKWKHDSLEPRYSSPNYKLPEVVYTLYKDDPWSLEYCKKIEAGTYTPNGWTVAFTRFENELFIHQAENGILNGCGSWWYSNIVKNVKTTEMAWGK